MSPFASLSFHQAVLCQPVLSSRSPFIKESLHKSAVLSTNPFITSPLDHKSFCQQVPRKINHIFKPVVQSTSLFANQLFCHLSFSHKSFCQLDPLPTSPIANTFLRFLPTSLLHEPVFFANSIQLIHFIKLSFSQPMLLSTHQRTNTIEYYTILESGNNNLQLSNGLIYRQK